MFTGLFAGVFWALDTVILGFALARSEFTNTATIILLAPFISTFLHDTISSIWMIIYIAWKKEFHLVRRALQTKSAKFIILGALLGGPIGMSGYVAAINYIGPAYTAIISALFPALGAFLSYIFLKEKMSRLQIFGLCCSILGIIALGYTPNQGAGSQMILGFACALLCCFGWASEAVVCAYGMKDPDISNEQALMIRQTVSAVTYGGILLTVLNGWENTQSILLTPSIYIILVAAFSGTTSYLCYYKAISTLGAAKAMALNITYSAWAIIFSAILLHTLPTIQSVFAGVIVVLGSLFAANAIHFNHQKTSL